ncbi:IMP 5'-nucleotidase, partial [Spiromyces aspiralis]
MTSLYRATYHLRSHKRDELIEFIKSMLLTPFVLHTSPAPITDVDRKQAQILSRVASQNTLATSPLSNGDNVTDNAQRIAEILGDIEELINEHIEMTRIGLERFSRLHRLVPTLGNFYTPLPLREAFLSSGNRYGIAGRL